MLYHGMMALDLARERIREQQADAARRALAGAAGAVRTTGRPPRPRPVRQLLAGVIRGFGDATHALGHAATAAAGRIEGPAA